MTIGCSKRPEALIQMDETNQKKILIADDEISVRFLLRRLLRRNYNVLEAINGEEAVDMARGEKPDIILMDIMMPKVDGYTACYTIKKDPVTKVIPIVMLTALGQELNVKLGKEIGADGYITKPFSPRVLVDTIAQFLMT